MRQPLLKFCRGRVCRYLRICKLQKRDDTKAIVRSLWPLYELNGLLDLGKGKFFQVRDNKTSLKIYNAI